MVGYLLVFFGRHTVDLLPPISKNSSLVIKRGEGKKERMSGDLDFLAEVSLISFLHVPMNLLLSLFHGEFSYFESTVL